MAGVARRLRRQRRLAQDSQTVGPAQIATPKIKPRMVGGRLYQVRRDGQLVVEAAEKTEEGWALCAQDQGFSNAIALEIERACEWFHVRPLPVYTCLAQYDTTSDVGVLARIAKFDVGENRREAKRTSSKRFPLEQLPHEWKRALIGNIERIKAEWAFAWIGD